MLQAAQKGAKKNKKQKTTLPFYTTFWHLVKTTVWRVFFFVYIFIACIFLSAAFAAVIVVHAVVVVVV